MTTRSSKKPTRKRGQAPTIRDVARRAGVSAMTVSRVINGKDSVRPETRERVREAIRATGFLPNEAARSLAGTRPLHLAMIYEKPTIYISDVLFGTLERTRQIRAQFIVELLDGRTATFEDLRRIVDEGVDGLLVAPPLSDSRTFLPLLKRLDLPMVLVTSASERTGLPTVRVDGYKAAAEVVRHLVSLGHRDIGFITGHPAHAASQDRLEGFRDSMASLGLPVREEWIVPGQFTYRSGLDAAERLLGGEYVPTAVFAANDEMAAAVISVAHRLGVEVPGELSVCGFDDAPFSATTWPALTTVHVPAAQLAHAAVDLLADLLSDDPVVVRQTARDQVIPYHLVRRDSDGPPIRR